MAVLEGFEKLRPVGALEQYSTARHHLGFYNNVAVTARHLVSYDPTLLKAQIYAACAALIAEHPRLSVIPLEEESRQPYFARLPKINLDEVVAFHTRKDSRAERDDARDAELDDILETQHNTSFKADSISKVSTFWRLIIISDPEDQSAFEAAFIYHHALGDGMSGFAFHRAFSAALASPIAASTNEVIPPNNPITPAMESLLLLPLSPLYILREVFYSIFPRRNRGVWLGNPVASTPRSRYRSMVFSKDTTAQLISLCKREETTVSALLQTQVAKTLFDLIPSHFGKLLCDGAAATRRWIDPKLVDDNTIGSFVAAYSETYSRDNFHGEDFPWPVARRSRENIQKFISTRGKNNPVGLLRFIADMNKMFLSKLGKPRTSSFAISNLGVFTERADGPNASTGGGDKKPRVGRVNFSQSGNHVGTPFEVCAATGGDGCLTVGIAWSDAALDEELLLQILEGVRKGLEGLVSDQRV